MKTTTIRLSIATLLELNKANKTSAQEVINEHLLIVANYMQDLDIENLSNINTKVELAKAKMEINSLKLNEENLYARLKNRVKQYKGLKTRLTKRANACVKAYDEMSIELNDKLKQKDWKFEAYESAYKKLVSKHYDAIQRIETLEEELEFCERTSNARLKLLVAEYDVNKPYDMNEIKRSSWKKDYTLGDAFYDKGFREISEVK